MSESNDVYSAAEIKGICLAAGADDAGLADFDREGSGGILARRS